MPTKSRPENAIIRLFVLAYERGAWAEGELKFPDEEEDGGIDGLATKPNGERLAIEHTVVEPFVGDIADQTEMVPMFPTIESETSLLVPDLWIRVFVPVGTLHLQKLINRAAISHSIRHWLLEHRLRLEKGWSKQACTVSGGTGSADYQIQLSVEVVEMPGPGSIQIRRQQTEDTLGDVIGKTLRRKLPKLVNTPASQRILILERQHMNLYPKRIHGEIENRRAEFPELSKVDGIWIAEKIPFFQPTDGDVRFELYQNGNLAINYDFRKGRLFGYGG